MSIPRALGRCCRRTVLYCTAQHLRGQRPVAQRSGAARPAAAAILVASARPGVRQAFPEAPCTGMQRIAQAAEEGDTCLPPHAPQLAHHMTHSPMSSHCAVRSAWPARPKPPAWVAGAGPAPPALPSRLQPPLQPARARPPPSSLTIERRRWRHRLHKRGVPGGREARQERIHRDRRTAMELGSLGTSASPNLWSVAAASPARRSACVLPRTFHHRRRICHRMLILMGLDLFHSVTPVPFRRVRANCLHTSV